MNLEEAKQHLRDGRRVRDLNGHEVTLLKGLDGQERLYFFCEDGLSRWVYLPPTNHYEPFSLINPEPKKVQLSRRFHGEIRNPEAESGAEQYTTWDCQFCGYSGGARNAKLACEEADKHRKICVKALKPEPIELGEALEREIRLSGNEFDYRTLEERCKEHDRLLIARVLEVLGERK